MTGRYSVFWDKFYKSAEKYFLPGHKKHYFVFTDNKTIQFPHNVTRIEASYTRFSEVTLKRFEMFLQIENRLASYDYLFFFNTNAQFIAPIYREVFPTPEQGLTVVF